MTNSPQIASRLLSRPILRRDFQLTFSSFFVLYLAYAVGSIFLFLLSSGGWTGIFILICGWIPFAILLVILGIFAAYLHKGGMHWISIAGSDLAAILILQACLIALNLGDCGDAPGGYFFFERILNFGKDLCASHATADSAGMVLGGSALEVLWWAFPILLIAVLVRSFAFATSEPIRRPALLRSYRLPIAVLGVVAVIGFVFYYNTADLTRRVHVATIMKDIEVLENDPTIGNCEAVDRRIAEEENSLWSFAFPCWTGLAIKEQDPRYCDKLTEKDSRATCIQRLEEKGIRAPSPRTD